MTRVLLAPDKFKGTCTAAEVAEHLGRGLRAAGTLEVFRVPVADGGDGMVDAVLESGFEAVRVDVTDAIGRPHRSTYAVRDREAVLEMASLCGLAGLDGDLAPMTASSVGVGQAVSAALDAGVERIVLGIGGSASTDGGAGLLVGLGARLLDRDGVAVPAGGGTLGDVETLDLSGLRPDLSAAELLVACDVDNPLTGPHGAAHVYGPQKGATREQVDALDAGLAHWADVVARATGTDLRDVPGAGAAGGVGFAAHAVLGAALRPGAELVLGLTGFDDALAGADLVITGEGALDAQTLRGKAPAAVARKARAHGIPVLAVCGRRDLSTEDARNAGFDRVWALTELVEDDREALVRAPELLEQVGAQLAQWLAERAS